MWSVIAGHSHCLQHYLQEDKVLTMNITNHGLLPAVHALLAVRFPHTILTPSQPSHPHKPHRGQGWWTWWTLRSRINSPHVVPHPPQVCHVINSLMSRDIIPVIRSISDQSVAGPGASTKPTTHKFVQNTVSSNIQEMTLSLPPSLPQWR